MNYEALQAYSAAGLGWGTFFKKCVNCTATKVYPAADLLLFLFISLLKYSYDV